MFLDIDWFCPLLIKSLRFDILIKVLFAILLEKTIIFVSDEILKSSNAVLAMKALIFPFNIYHSIIPVLPNALIDYLEAPVPMLIGV